MPFSAVTRKVNTEPSGRALRTRCVVGPGLALLPASTNIGEENEGDATDSVATLSTSQDPDVSALGRIPSSSSGGRCFFSERASKTPCFFRRGPEEPIAGGGMGGGVTTRVGQVPIFAVTAPAPLLINSCI